MLSTSNYNPFPCIGCNHTGICKYEDSVMSFCRANSASGPAIDCLTLEYKCKHRDAASAYATSLYAKTATVTRTNCDTGKAYAIDPSSECIN